MDIMIDRSKTRFPHPTGCLMSPSFNLTITAVQVKGGGGLTQVSFVLCRSLLKQQEQHSPQLLSFHLIRGYMHALATIPRLGMDLIGEGGYRVWLPCSLAI